MGKLKVIILSHKMYFSLCHVNNFVCLALWFNCRNNGTPSRWDSGGGGEKKAKRVEEDMILTSETGLYNENQRRHDVIP